MGSSLHLDVGLGPQEQSNNNNNKLIYYPQLANSLVFLLYLLSSREDWQEKIRKELPSTGEIDSEALAAAPSVKAAIYEAFRLLPIAPFLARILEAPLTVEGHRLPPKAGILLLILK